MRCPDSIDGAVSGHIRGFDYARCVLAVLVVVLHTRALGLSSRVDPVYHHVCTLAVPSFMLISLYLFVAKGEVRGRSLARRVQRLLLLFIFWSAAYAVVFQKTDSVLRDCQSVKGLYCTAIEGGNPIFYFFSCLAFVTLVAASVCRLAHRVLCPLAIVSTCGLWFMSSLAGGMLSEELVTYYNPLNFLPYAFVAPLIVAIVRSGVLKSSTAKTAAIFAVLCAAWVAVTLLETSFLHTADGRSPSPYSRPSAVVGALTVVGSFLLISRPAPLLVRRLADCSLGIYCVHYFVKESAAIATVEAQLPRLFVMQGAGVGEATAHFAHFVIVLVVSIAIVAFLRHALARQMI
jgi:surface polysaccharide O-acyltransferase-like enzyme